MRYGTELFHFFNFLAHPLRRCFDTPEKSPKNEEIESAIRNRGTVGSHKFWRESGSKFILRSLNPWMFSGHTLRRKHYYTSDRRKALLYFDVDCHLAYQTEADAIAARTLIEQEMTAFFGVCPLFLGSDRGENGYLKVDLSGATPQKANEVFDALQKAIRLLFAKHGVMADFEIKGTITWMDEQGTLHAGRYGKLPMCSPAWDYRWHLSLVRARTVSLRELEAFVAKVRGEITEEDVRRHEEARHRAFLTHYLPVAKDQMWRLREEFGNVYEEQLATYRGRQWIARSWVGEEGVSKFWPDYQPETLEDRTSLDMDLSVAGVEEASVAPVDPKLRPQDVADLVHEPDSFLRQREALLSFARLLKRVPTLDEALEYIRVNGLYTGAWKNPSRRSRVRSILKFIARTFDARKCSRRPDGEASVNIGKFDSWAQKKFPKGFVGGTRKKVLTEDLEVVEVQQNIKVSPEYLSVFMAVVEYALLLNKNEDGSLPHERAKQLWTWLYQKRLVALKFDDRKWAVCREEMVKYGVIVITDRDYSTGKAMRWAVGVYFPLLGLWKAKKQPSLLGPGCWRQLGCAGVSTERGQHNSLLRQQSFSRVVLALLAHSRPPPTVDTG